MTASKAPAKKAPVKAPEKAPEKAEEKPAPKVDRDAEITEALEAWAAAQANVLVLEADLAHEGLQPRYRSDLEGRLAGFKEAQATARAKIVGA